MDDTIGFEKNKLVIRLIEKKDLELLRQHRNDFKTWHNLTDINLIYKEQQESWYMNLIQDRTKKYFMVSGWVNNNNIVTKEDIGFIRIDEIDALNRSARIGCDVFKSFRTQGFGTKIMDLACSYGFDYLNIHRLWLLVVEYNISAISVYKKTGFIQEGVQKQALYRDGKYYNYLMFSYINPKELCENNPSV